MAGKKFEKLEENIEVIKTHIGQINVTLGEQHVSLKDHIRRTELLEGDVIPMKKEWNMVHGALKFIGLLSIVAGIAEAIYKLLGH